MTVRRSIMKDLEEQAPLPSTLERGLELYRLGNADVASTERDEAGFADVAGTVRGVLRASYRVTVMLDERELGIIEHTCECPAHAEYGGVCKHVVALTLAYLDELEGVPTPQPASPSSAARSPKNPAPARARKRRVRTSQEITRLMASYANRAQEEVRLAGGGAYAQADAGEPADLQCVISSGESAYRYSWSDSGTWSLGLKVSRGSASYVVKHIDDLVDAWRSGAVVRYGKNLEFAHRPAAFTDRANELLDLLSDVLEAQESLYVAQESKYYWYSPDRRLSTKTLPLSSGQMGAVLDLMLGSKVVVETYRYERNRGGTHTKRTVPVVDADPVLEVEISPTGDGYSLSVHPDDFECIVGDGRLYLMGEKAVHRCSPGFSSKLGPFCEALLPGKTALKISGEDMPGFCASVLGALRDHTRLAEPEGLDALLPPQAEFRFRIGLSGGYVTCVASVLYDDVELSLFEPVRSGQPTRHVVREMAAQQAVLAYFPQGEASVPDYAYSPLPQERVLGRGLTEYQQFMRASQGPGSPWFAEDDDEAYYRLFTEGLRELAGFGEVLLSERLRNVTVRQAPSVRVEASVKGNLLDIAVDSSDMSPGELVSYLSSFQRRQKFVRLGNGDIVRLDGSVSAIADLAGGLGLEASQLVEGAAGIPSNRTLFVDAVLKRASGVRFQRDAGFRAIVRDFETVADADFTPPASLRDVMRPYQMDGFKWLCTLGKAGFGGILADDMGLGKTLQMMACLSHARDAGEDRPALVVCPASLVYNWVSEFERFAPDMDVLPVAGGKRARVSQIATADAHDVLITSYDLMKRDIEAYVAQEFHCVVLDEAQYIKNSATKAAKAAKELRADVRFALTGTPIENRLQELWSIFDFLMPGVLGTFEAFARRFATPIGDGDEAAARRLQGLVAPFILRRLKGDVLRDLPDKNESVVLSEMEGEQDKLYRASASKLALMLSDQPPEEFAGMKLKVLAELTKLRQICCDPALLYDNYTGGSAKLETCLELVRSAVEGGHQVLLFSQFTSMFDILGPRLGAAGVTYLRLTGATSKEERLRLVRRFQDGGASVFLISLKAGGVGLNLTAADIVIHYDPWWNLAAQNQATDRAHRIGQEREVSVFKLIAKGTVEEKIVQMQESKHDLAEQVLGGDAVGRTAITREDILALLDAGL